MPPEVDEELDDQERDEPVVEGLGPQGQKALESERKARKEAERKARESEKRTNETLQTLRTERFQRFKTQHPWLEEADLEGVELDAWDTRVSRLAAIAGARTTTEEPTTVPDTERANLEKLAD